MYLTPEQARDKEVYTKLSEIASSRIKEGEEHIWRVLPYDPESDYHKLSTVYIDPLEDLDPDYTKQLTAYGLANYRHDLQNKASSRLESIIEDFRIVRGDEVRDIVDSGEHLAINVDHQSRFSALIASAIVQFAISESREDANRIRQISSTIVTRYLECYGVNMGAVLNNPQLPVVNALEIARNFSGIIPIFPDTELRQESEVDPVVQEKFNSKAIIRSRPRTNTPMLRTFVASAASDEQMSSGGYRMRSVGDQVKRLFSIGNWHTMSVATNIDPGDVSKTFFVPSEITPSSEYSMDTLDEHNLWIAQTRQERTGEPVIYIPNESS